MPPVRTRYSGLSQLLHWVIAALIALQFLLANLAEIAGDADAQLRQLALLANHKSVGMTVLLLAVVRLLWRMGHPPPPHPATMPRWQRLASSGVHGLLYGLLFALPVSGWLMSSASAYSVSWFNLFQFPDMVQPDPQLKSQLESLHETLAWALGILATLHIAAAVKHHLVDRDDVLLRMSGSTSLATGLLLAVLGGWWWGFRTPTLPVAVAPVTTSDAPEIQAAASRLAPWNIVYAESFIRFTGIQAGAEFSGEWREWSADIRFDRAALNDSVFDVAINTAEVDTGDSERDTAMQGVDWFDVINHPEAFYRANAFNESADGRFVADGRLIIKGFGAPVPLHFTVEAVDGRLVLVGEAALLRLDLGVGTGDWLDTSWVGNEVTVEVRVVAEG